MGQAAADIPDMLMHAENFLHHDNDRERVIRLCRAGEPRGHILALGGDRCFSAMNGIFGGMYYR
ncbi:hypothetical protein VNF293_19620 [Atlantibacter hermannii]